VVYVKIFVTGNFMSSCRRWNEKEAADKTWTDFKIHFAAAHRKHKQMQGEYATKYGYYSANAAVEHTDDQMADATIGALANLETVTATDLGMVSTLTDANVRLARQLVECSKEVKEVKSLLKKDHVERRGQRPFTPSLENYCWYHGYKVSKIHTNQSCNLRKDGHTCEATKANNMGGCQAKK
jgi:hypothetical protein